MRTYLTLTLILLYFVFNISAKTKNNTEHIKINDSKFYDLAKANIEKYRKTDFIIRLKNISPNEIDITIIQQTHKFLFGCIIFDLVNPNKMLNDEDLFKQQFRNLFNFAVFPFYWEGYEQIQGITNQQKIKEISQWCINNNITCKGHPLVWTNTSGTPKWLTNYTTDKTKTLLQDRVEKIVYDFKDHIKIWDVVNEPVNTVTWNMAISENMAGKENRYGKDLPLEMMTGFVDSCFRWAYNANPEASLVLNEFNIIASEYTRKRFYNFMKILKRKKTPVSGIGIQAHEPNKGHYFYSPEQIWSTFDTYNKFNLPLHITELIPVSNGDSIKGDYKTGIWTEQTQADFAKMIFTLSFGYPAVESINWWGFSDRNIWQEGGGLVDKNLQPKIVYNTLDRLINHDWKTELNGLKPNKKGETSFRGFKGDYKIIVRKAGKIINTSYLKFDNSEKTRTEFDINLGNLSF